jgi:hypothetical protein
MVVEALFWFHPLVWWIGSRLVEERERACDQAVVQAGSEAQVYAEGILNVCKFYVESPLACASGVTGSELKQRIVWIMSGQRRKPRLRGLGLEQRLDACILEPRPGMRRQRRHVRHGIVRPRSPVRWLHLELLGFRRSAWNATIQFSILKVMSSVTATSGPVKGHADIWYSLDGGSTWKKLYASYSTRNPVYDTVTLSPTQDITKIQVCAFTDAHDDIAHQVMEIGSSSSRALRLDPRRSPA